MRHAALALIAALAFVPVALAQDDKKPEEKDTSPALPLHPLAGAKEGDWSVFECVMKAKKFSEKKLQTWRVSKVTEATIEIAESMGDGTGPVSRVTLPVKDAPTFAKYFDIRGSKVENVQTADEKKKVGDREFACKKVTFDTDDGQQKTHAIAWLSADVKGSGLVALRIETTVRDQQVVIDFEVAGFGAKDKTDFGKTREQLMKELKKDAASDEPKKDEKK